MSRFRVQTGCRLHFGPLAAGPGAGRRFGGVGCMIAAPGLRLTAERAETAGLVSTGQPGEHRILEFAAQCCDRTPHWPRACRWTLEAGIPEHCGFGSGTQLAMAVGRLLSCLAGEADIGVAELALRTGRGERSGIGAHGFVHGGFLVDAGKRDASPLGSIAARLDFPTEWRWVLVTPHAEAGPTGASERIAFQQLGAMPETLTERLCRMVLTEVMPAVAESDWAGAAASLDEYGRQVGKFFAPVQGGVFASPRITELAEQLRGKGAPGIAQSSWGPTIAVLCRDADQATWMLNEARKSCDATYRVTSGLNTGATVERLAS